MDNDDRPIGRVLSRREVLALLGLTGAGAIVGCTPTATLTGQATTTPAVPTATSQPRAQAPSATSTGATSGKPTQTVFSPSPAATGATSGSSVSLEAATATAMAGNPTGTVQQAASTTIAGALSTVIPSCVVRPAMTEGPYYVDVNLDRSDIARTRRVVSSRKEYP